MAQMAGNEGDLYRQLAAERATAFGPSANPMGSFADQNTGYFAPGSGTSGDPWEQPTARWKGYGKGADGGVVKLQAGGAAPAASGYGSLGTLGSTGTAAPTMGSAYTGSSVGSYSLPGSTAASQSLRDLQMGGTAGLQGLMSRDTTASRKAIEDALYAGQEEGINTAADRSRQAMLEGTFGRGVGSSSILVELAGRGEQERGDALARARREAFTQAGSEDRADLASQLGLSQAGFTAGTTGLQAEANVALANLAREQQESQFGRNLAFQGGENAANRAQTASQFGQNLGLSYAQLGQQGSQFGQNLAFQGSEGAANRAQQTAMQTAQMEQALAMLAQQQEFAGGQNALGREFQGSQNALTRDQQNQNLLLQLAGAQEIASGNRLASGIGAAGAGAGALLGPWLAQYIKGLGE